MTESPIHSDVMIVGGGAAGMMCAREAARRGRSVRVIEHMTKTGEKIRISGGGRCNFTNLFARLDLYLSQNPHFCKSALSRYTPQDFIALLDEKGIAWHEKPCAPDAHESARGQLFCDGSALQIADMLRGDAELAGARFEMETMPGLVTKDENGFRMETNRGVFTADALVIASGGLSIPKIGAGPFGYRIAERFGVAIVPPRAGLVPPTFGPDLLERTKPLSGLSVEATVTSRDGTRYTEGLLFTHRGLSGPVILQISSHWREGETITVDLAPGRDMYELLRETRNTQPKQALHTALSVYLPKRLAQFCAAETGPLGGLSDAQLRIVADAVNRWIVKPQGSEGYRTAEVTIGGVDTRALSSKTMEARAVPGLYFIGEVVDVTGPLGGHNFQWAWASGVAAGQAV